LSIAEGFPASVIDIETRFGRLRIIVPNPHPVETVNLFSHAPYVYDCLYAHGSIGLLEEAREYVARFYNVSPREALREWQRQYGTRRLIRALQNPFAYA
jgi:hypothetical protein